jgi:AmmeMemoRadiSam system protein B
MVDEYPKIRQIQIIPIQSGGEILVGLRDPQELSPQSQMVVMSRDAFQIVTFFDGSNSLSDIQALLTREMGGVLFPRAELERLVDALDTNFLLDNERYAEALAAYARETVRKAVLPGRNIPAEAQELDTFFAQVMQQAPTPAFSGRIAAVMAPHIDVSRAMPTYAAAYGVLSAYSQAEIFVIFGTAHEASPETRFAFTRKSYETPWGVVPVAQEFLRRIERKTTHNLYAAEILHKGEHSAEFAALFLQHTIGKKRPLQIVPVLVGSFHDCLHNETSPREMPEIREILESIAEVAEEIGKDKICWLASVDMAHVGLRFGDEAEVDDASLLSIREADMDAIKAIENCEAEEFFQTLMPHRNRYRICGMSSIYSLLCMLEESGVQGKLLHYDQSREAESGSVVTFASVSFGLGQERQ